MQGIHINNIFVTMRYTQTEIEQRDKILEDTVKAKIIFRQLIYPSREYLNYFLEYFPDWNTASGKNKIRSCWNGQTADGEFLKMLNILIQKQKND